MAVKYVVYKAFSKSGQLLYVGITSDFIRRMGSHASSSVWFQDMRKLCISDPMTKAKALAYEAKCIANDSPVYNVAGAPSVESIKAPEAVSMLADYIEGMGLTQKEFSKRSGVSESMLTRIMQGRTPKLDALMKIRKATNGQVRPEHWT